MTLLSAISVVCFFAMLWLAIAVVQRLRSRVRLQADDNQSAAPPSREFFEAGEYRAPGSLRLIQHIDQKVSQRSSPAAAAVVETKAQQLSTAPEPALPGFVERRKSGKPVPHGIPHGILDRRADRAHYNKDMGDLSDPYSQSRPPSESGVRLATSAPAQPQSARPSGRSGLHIAVKPAAEPSAKLSNSRQHEPTAR